MPGSEDTYLSHKIVAVIVMTAIAALLAIALRRRLLPQAVSASTTWAGRASIRW